MGPPPKPYTLVPQRLEIEESIPSPCKISEIKISCIFSQHLYRPSSWLGMVVYLVEVDVGMYVVGPVVKEEMVVSLVLGWVKDVGMVVHIVEGKRMVVHIVEGKRMVVHLVEDEEVVVSLMEDEWVRVPLVEDEGVLVPLVEDEDHYHQKMN